jgi:beta-1,4-mannooligosaccharide/beta-1,4-mannosyl-N-acetylglucosamine phosphorylase
MSQCRIPCAALHDIEEDKLAIYGAADTVTMVFGKLSEVIKYTKNNSL